jgi:hypothetical protein
MLTNALAGLALSRLGGGIFAHVILWALRKYQGLGEKPKRSEGEPNRVPPWLTGVTERLFFTIIVAFDISGAATAMIGWITLKLVSNWNRTSPQSPEHEQWSAWAFSALIGGLVSMLFALLGGLVCSGKLKLW